MKGVPQSSAAYAQREYWEERFESEDQYEWFSDYSQFRHLLQPHIPPQARLLILGNGTSQLPFDLATDGYLNITATDICSNVVQRLNKKKEELLNLGVVFEVADVLELPYRDGSFDVIVEKGMLDAFFADATSPWNPPIFVCQRMETALKQVHRVLTDAGIFFSITFAQPQFRKRFLNEFKWSCHVEKFGDPGCLEYFVYQLNKGENCPKALKSPQKGNNEALVEDPMHEYLDDACFLSFMNLP